MALFQFLAVASVFAIGLSSAFLHSHKDEVEDRIVGGFVTTIEEHPWQISFHRYGSHTCGGSIIGRNWVLSAAHCEGESVRVGSSYHARDGQLVRIKRIIRHEKYTLPPIDFDFALLELAEPLNYTDKIQPIGLPDANHAIDDGTVCLASGWGLTQSNSESREKLRAVYLPIVNQEHCRQVYAPDAPDWVVTPRMICAGYNAGGKSICQGDSGGPLIEYNNGVPRVIGLSSWLRGCGVPRYPAVFSRVSAAREWIRGHTGI